MNVLTAHQLLASRKDRSIFPHAVSLRGHPELDAWPAVVTGACVLSGSLDDAVDDDDLNDCVRQFEAYWDMGAVTDDDLEREAMNVIGELMTWGEQQERAGVAMLPASAAAYN